MTSTPHIDRALPPVLQRDGACLREVVARRHGRRRNPARRPPRTPVRTLSNPPRHRTQRWVEKCDRSVANSETPQTANTAFLASSHNPPGGNAKATRTEATFWIETIAGTGGHPDVHQLQYTQLVMLDFNGIHWPHVTVGTLVKQ